MLRRVTLTKKIHKANLHTKPTTTVDVKPTQDKVKTSEIEKDPWHAVFANVGTSSPRRSFPPTYFTSRPRKPASPPSSSRGYSTRVSWKDAALADKIVRNLPKPPPVPPGGTNYASPTPPMPRSEQGKLWDAVLDDASPDDATLIPSRPLLAASSSVNPRRIRKQGLTLQEDSVFADMFKMIFDSADAGKRRQKRRAMDPLSGVGIGRGPGEDPPSIDDLYDKTTRRSNRRAGRRQFRDTSESEAILDALRHEMEVIETDQALLAWAMEKVFPPTDAGEHDARGLDASPSSPQTVAPPSSQDHHPDPSTYPHLLSALISTFRDKFHDPHLALSIFAYARHVSTASYVTGCTTSTYNQLLETRWTSLRDLRGVVNALEEMKANGVGVDAWTRRICEKARRESMVDGQADGEDSMALLARMDRLTMAGVYRPSSRRLKKPEESRWSQQEGQAEEHIGDRLELT